MVIAHLSVSPPLLYPEAVELAEALSPSPSQDSQITDILVAALTPAGRDEDSLEAPPIFSALVRRSLSQAQRRVVVACCRRTLSADLSTYQWVLPAATELGVDTEERHGLVMTAVQGLRTTTDAPSSLGGHLAALGALSDENKELLAEEFAECYDRLARRDTEVGYAPYRQWESLYDQLVDLGLDAVAAMDRCLPLDADRLAMQYENPIRKLARRTRQAVSYDEWARALAAWSSVDRALYTSG